MPELPEVQTTVNGLQIIIKKYISSFKINTTKLRYLIPNNIINVAKNKKIINIYRIAKYIIIELNNNISLIFHLGMSGRIKLFKIKSYKIIKHDHILIELNNKNVIVFNDPRKFGFIDFSKTTELKYKKYILNLGLDPFERRLNKEYLINKFYKSKTSIKQILLNQNIICGIGNIYACEILFDARISPFMPANKLNDSMVNELIKSIRKILKKAIISGGSSLRNYVSADGILGNFQNNFKVYNQEGKKIYSFKIRRIKQNGRSTFYCPKLQKSNYNPFR